MTERAEVEAPGESSLSIDLDELSQKPGVRWKADEFERYLEHQYEPQRYKQLISAGRSKLGTKEDAEDAWGTFVTDKVAAAVMKYDPSKHRTINTWISYKFEHFCQDIFRKQLTRQAKLDTHLRVVLTVLNLDREVNLTTVAEARDSLQRVFETLSDDERQLFILRLVEERPLREIAVRLSVAEGTIKSRLSSLRKRLTMIARELEQPNRLRVLGQAQ